MGREESVVQARPPRCMPRQPPGQQQQQCNLEVASITLPWIVKSLPGASTATLLVRLHRKQLALLLPVCFEWDWLSHQLLLLGPKRKAKQAVTARSSQPAGSSAEEPDDVLMSRRFKAPLMLGKSYSITSNSL